MINRNSYKVEDTSLDTNPGVLEQGTKKTKTVLVFEDEPMSQKVIDAFLSKQGYDVLIAENGSEGIDIYSNRKDLIDLVVMNGRMPGMDGVEATQALRKMSSDLPIIGYSAAFAMNPSPLLDAGCNEFVPKPELKTLCSVVDSYLSD